MSGWIGVDFDGTLAKYGKYVSPTHCGEPVPAMVARVKRWLADGREVRIFTARVYPINECIGVDVELTCPTWDEAREEAEAAGVSQQSYKNHIAAVSAAAAIRAWCIEHIGQALPITNVKDFSMMALYDDRAVQVVPNTGLLVAVCTRDDV